MRFSWLAEIMAPGKIAPAKKNPRAWESLTPALPQWILDAVASMGFAQMTPVQTATMPHFMGNKDVVVEVKTSINPNSLLWLTSFSGCHR